MFDPMKVAYTPQSVVLMIQAFADGAAGGDGGSGSGTGVGASVPAAQGSEAVHPAKDATEAGGVSTGQKGGAEKAPDAATSEPDYDKEFEAFMKRPEMKQRMGEHTKRAVNARFRESRENSAKNAQSDQIIKRLAVRYGVSETDHDALMQAIEADSLYESARAEAAGIDLNTQRELDNYRAAKREEAARREAEEGARKTADLRMEARRVAKEFPDFDLDTYLADERFVERINKGDSVREAYTALNFDHLMTATAKFAAEKAAKEAEERMAATIRQNLARPAEGGADGGKPTAGEKIDFNSMSDADFKAFRERVQRGEVIPL